MSCMFGREVDLIYDFDIFPLFGLSRKLPKACRIKMEFLRFLFISSAFADDLRRHWLEEELINGKKLRFKDSNAGIYRECIV